MKDQIKCSVIDNTAFMFLDMEIDSYVSSYLTRQMYEMKERGLDIVLKINSIGGSVIAGQSIIDAIVTTKATTHIVGIAASMAGIIAQYGAKRIASSNSLLMIHAPSGAKDADLLEKVRSGLKKTLMSKTSFDEDKIDTMLSDGSKDYFFDAEEMLENGLIDEIVDIEADVELENLTQNNDVADIYNIFNQAIKKPKIHKMEVIKNTLKLDKNASEEKVNEAVSEVVNKLQASDLKNEELQKQVQNLKNENTSLKEAQENAKKAEISALINSYVEKGIVTDENKEKFESLANADMELAKSVLNSLKDTVKSSADYINNDNGQSNNGVVTVDVFNKMSAEEKAEFARTNPIEYNKILMA